MSFAIVPRPRRGFFGPASLARDAERLFDELWAGFPGLAPAFGAARRGGFVPQLDVVETDEAYWVSAELPGLEEKDFEIVWEAGVLTLKGEKRGHAEPEQGRRHRSESAAGRFERRLRFAGAVDPDRIEASYQNGILSVVLPKPAKAQAQEIPVQTG